MKITTTENIKPGYQQTSVGIVPEDWGVEKIEKCTTRIGDGIHSTPKYSSDGEYYFVNGNNFRFGQIVVDDSTKKVNEEEFNKHSRELADRTILMSINGTIGNLAYYNNENIVLGKSACYLNINNQIDLEYFYYQIGSYLIQKNFLKRLTGSTIKNLGLKEIRKTKLPIPPLPEQEQIASCLTTWDQGIEKLSTLIEAKKQQKKGVMQGLLTGKKRLPGFTEEWQEVKLGEVAKIVMGASPRSSEYNDKGIGSPLIQGNTDLKNRVSSPRQHTSQITKTCLIGDILMSVRAPVGEISKSIHKACIGRGVCAIRSTEKMENNFLYYNLIYTEYLWDRFKQGSTFESVNSEDIRSFKLLKPSLKEQTAIAEILSKADQEIDLLEKKLESMQSQKKGLMQVLLTGEKRLVT